MPILRTKKGPAKIRKVKKIRKTVILESDPPGKSSVRQTNNSSTFKRKPHSTPKSPKAETSAKKRIKASTGIKRATVVRKPSLARDLQSAGRGLRKVIQRVRSTKAKDVPKIVSKKVGGSLIKGTKLIPKDAARIKRRVKQASRFIRKDFLNEKSRFRRKSDAFIKKHINI